MQKKMCDICHILQGSKIPEFSDVSDGTKDFFIVDLLSALRACRARAARPQAAIAIPTQETTLIKN